MTDQSRIEDLRRRVQKDPASIAFAQLAEEYRRAGQLQDAVDVCRAGLAIHPGYLSARVTLGRALLELEQFDDAQQRARTGPEERAGEPGGHSRARRDPPQARRAAPRRWPSTGRRWCSRRTIPISSRRSTTWRLSSSRPRRNARARAFAMSMDAAPEPAAVRDVRIVAALEQWLAAIHVTRAQRQRLAAGTSWFAQAAARPGSTRSSSRRCPNILYLTNFTGSAAIVVLTPDRVIFLTDSRYVTAIDSLAEVAACVPRPGAHDRRRLVRHRRSLGSLRRSASSARRFRSGAPHRQPPFAGWRRRLPATAAAACTRADRGLVEAARVIKDDVRDRDAARRRRRGLSEVARGVFGEVRAGTDRARHRACDRSSGSATRGSSGRRSTRSSPADRTPRCRTPRPESEH